MAAPLPPGVVLFEWYQPEGRERDELHAAILEMILGRLLGLRT